MRERMRVRMRERENERERMRESTGYHNSSDKIAGVVFGLLVVFGGLCF